MLRDGCGCLIKQSLWLPLVYSGQQPCCARYASRQQGESRTT